jgi:hypothetical protein
MVSKRVHPVATIKKFPDINKVKLLVLECDFEVTYLLLANSTPDNLVTLTSLKLHF